MDWLGDAAFTQSVVAPKLIYQIEPEHGGPPLRLKLEINTRETKAFDGPYEISHAMSVLNDVNAGRLIEIFLEHLLQDGIGISRAQAEERMWAKLENPGFLSNIRPLLSADAADELTNDAVMIAFARVMTDLVSLIPGNPWARSSDMAEKFGVSASLPPVR